MHILIDQIYEQITFKFYNEMKSETSLPYWEVVPSYFQNIVFQVC